MKKYKNEIKGMLNKLFDEDTASNIFEANFPSMTKEEAAAEKKKERITFLLEKGASGKKLTKLQAKELRKLL